MPPETSLWMLEYTIYNIQRWEADSSAAGDLPAFDLEWIRQGLAALWYQI